jgi:hypothetical protein
MDGTIDGLIRFSARQVTGRQRRAFLALVCNQLCDGSARKAEERFGWGRDAVASGLLEQSGQSVDKPTIVRHSTLRSEVRNPKLGVDIRLIVEPHTHTDPELKTARLYSNLSAGEVRAALVEKGYSGAQLPSERTLRDILNRMNYRLKRIQKGKPLKKNELTSPIFENVKAARDAASGDKTILEISVDTKTKVSLGEYVLGGKNQDR